MVFELGKTIGGSVGEMASGQAGDAFRGRFGGATGNIGGNLVGSVLGMANRFLFGQGRLDPELAFQFYLEFDALVTPMDFKECKGIEWETEVTSFREGGNNRHEQHLIGPARFKPLEIKRGFMGAHAEFFKWMYECADSVSKNPIKRKNFSLVVCNDAMYEVARFDFYNAFISKWQGPALDAGANEIAFESMTIVYDYFDFVAGGSIANAINKKLGQIASKVGGAILSKF